MKRFIIFTFILSCSLLSASEYDDQFKKGGSSLSKSIILTTLVALPIAGIIGFGIYKYSKGKLGQDQGSPSNLRGADISTFKEADISTLAGSSSQSNSDTYDLNRFVKALEKTDMSHNNALSELKNGRKETHWIWPNFPQIDGLIEKSSDNTKFYSIKSMDEAKAYLSHEKLGPWLLEKTKYVYEFNGEIGKDGLMGSDIDRRKLKSSMTLFDKVSTDKDNYFGKVLNKHFNGKRDIKTLNILGYSK